MKKNIYRNNNKQGKVENKTAVVNQGYKLIVNEQEN
jgi:hypothetical protein